jgi:hypothetical protein
MWAGGGVGVVGGGSSAGWFHRRSRQCVVTKSSSRDALQLICSDAAIVHLVHFGSLWLRRATACDRAWRVKTLGTNMCNPKACVTVGGRWVPADGSNSRRRAPLLEEAWPRSGDEAGCNPQVAADLALSWGYRWQEPLFCRVVCPRRATGSVIGSFEQRTVSRLEGLS